MISFQNEAGKLDFAEKLDILLESSVAGLMYVMSYEIFRSRISGAETVELI